MSRRKQHPAPEQKHAKPEQAGIVFSFQLSLSGIIGIGVVLFCLFLWMFLIGIWAGQTLLHSSPSALNNEASRTAKSAQAKLSLPAATPSSVSRSEESKPSAEQEQEPAAKDVLLRPRERKKRIAAPAAGQ